MFDDPAAPQTVLQWLWNNAIALVLYLILSVAAWLKLGDLAKLRQAFENHIKSEKPHDACPVHASILEEIRNSLRNVNTKLDIIDDRVFKIVQDRSNKKND